MSVLVDANEPEEISYLLRQMGLDVTVGNYNQTPGTDIAFPDFQVINHGYVGVNRKQAVEAMGDLDKVEDQLRRELRVCENLVFVYEGCLTWAEEGTYAGDAEASRVDHHRGRSGNEYDMLTSRGRTLSQPFARWTSFVWRAQNLGVPVVATGNVRGTATFLHALHANHTNTLFRRLLRVRQEVREEDPKLRAYKSFLLGIPGWGPEVVEAVVPIFPNTAQLVAFLSEGGKLGDLVLRSGRKLGPALEKRTRQFLGATA